VSFPNKLSWTGQHVCCYDCYYRRTFCSTPDHELKSWWKVNE